MAEKRELQMKEITEQLEQGVKELFTSEMYTEYLRTMSQFHNYSFNNTLLIAMQETRRHTGSRVSGMAEEVQAAGAARGEGNPDYRTCTYPGEAGSGKD